MNDAFRRRYRDLRLATVFALFAALAFLSLAYLSALGGFVDAVASFREAAFVMGIVFGGLFVLFVAASILGALIRFLSPVTSKP